VLVNIKRRAAAEQRELPAQGGITQCAFQFLRFRGWLFALKSGSTQEQIGPQNKHVPKGPSIYLSENVYKGYELLSPKSSRLNPGTPTGLYTSPGSSIAAIEGWDSVHAVRSRGPIILNENVHGVYLQ
jgi:hypothetical protein